MKIRTIAAKELSTYFNSPVAFIFLGTFLLVAMFSFFWVEEFFVRNIVDLRPLFESMPVLLIFLVAALTMKMWSEERRMGTIEFLLTMPVKTHELVLGKFLACLALVAIALALTFGLPITVSMMGNLDWGPVIGAYLASVLLAGAYVSVGLFVSSRSDNQIVSLIVTIVLCMCFYLLGSSTLAALFGNSAQEVLRLFGTGSRFESINRGVIDIRDLYYYVSIIGVFLTWNVLSLERLKWSETGRDQAHRGLSWVCALLVVNLLIGNFWLQQTHLVRADLTQSNIYTISEATENVLDQLQEPLLIRGYFSAQTHPLLAPLVPQIRDLIEEYQVVSGGKVRGEFVDPRESGELEEEAHQKYNIKPVPFQISDRHQASLVNSYFDVLVQYGDQWEVLSFRDLIEVKPTGEGELEVRLKNLEYDLTRTIKKVLTGFRTTDNLFANMKNPVVFTAFFSAKEKLPEKLAEMAGTVEKVAKEYESAAGGKFKYEVKDPDADGGALAKEIGENYGFRPMAASLFDTNRFYFYMILTGAAEGGEEPEVVQVPLPENLTAEGLKTGLESALKRFSSGFVKTIGLVAPEGPPPNPMMGMMGGKQFRLLQEKLGETRTVKSIDLKNGFVPDDIDLLLLASPEGIDEKQLFAIDQFLMKGGTVIAATSPYSINRTPNSVAAQKHKSGLEEWLSHHGISFEDKMVFDTQNEPYPVPVRRQIGGFQMEEIKLVPYPPFVNVIGDGLNNESGITSGLPQVTLNWPSPINIDKEKNKSRVVTTLLKSSPESWTTSKTAVQPNFEIYGDLGFPVEGKPAPVAIALSVEGSFSSYFEGKESPLLKKEEGKKEEGKNQSTPEDAEKKADEPPVFSGVIAKSPDSSRIFVFGSNEFLNDQVLQVSAMGGSSRFVNSLQLVENSIDWSLEDRGLLSIRSREHFARTILPLTVGKKRMYELVNYGLVILGLLAVFFVHRMRRNSRMQYYRQLLNAA